jgi:predicted metalloprotease with PDZ domain
LLWAFEGITSYYDDLALLRCGLIEVDSYLELLAQTMSRVQRGFGRSRQSAAESSFNAWTRFYKQDENAANAIVSYYAKGCPG